MEDALEPFMAITRRHVHRDKYGECPLIASDIEREFAEAVASGMFPYVATYGTIGGYAKKRDGGSIHTARRPSQ